MSGRRRVSHADRVGSELWFTSDVAPIVHRLQEASFDVLLNKATWGTADSARRDAYSARRGTLDDEIGVFATAGLDFKMALHMFDSFGSFKLEFEKSAERIVPAGLWAMPIDLDLELQLTGEPVEA